MELLVKNNYLFLENKKYQCAVGKNGLTKNKIEGDLCTPLGVFQFSKIFYRPDRLGEIKFLINSSTIKKNDGWCDDQDSKWYNQYVQFPFKESAEHLYREDNIYDLVCVLNYNTSPVVAGKGSAIFLHLCRNNFEGTEGCIAIEKEILIKIATSIESNSIIRIEI